MALSLSNEQDQLDGELASRVFHFIRIQDITPAQVGFYLSSKVVVLTRFALGAWRCL